MFRNFVFTGEDKYYSFENTSDNFKRCNVQFPEGMETNTYGYYKTLKQKIETSQNHERFGGIFHS